jgi:hypothetical protein
VANARCTREELATGDVPAICVKTGVPCTNVVALRLRPPLLRMFAAPLTTPAIVAMVPARVRLHARLVVLSYVALALAVLGIVLLILGVGTPAAAALIVGVVAYVALLATGMYVWLSAIVERDDDVVLLRVHPNFARAVEE